MCSHCNSSTVSTLTNEIIVPTSFGGQPTDICTTCDAVLDINKKVVGMKCATHPCGKRSTKLIEAAILDKFYSYWMHNKTLYARQCECGDPLDKDLQNVQKMVGASSISCYDCKN